MSIQRQHPGFQMLVDQLSPTPFLHSTESCLWCSPGTHMTPFHFAYVANKTLNSKVHILNHIPVLNKSDGELLSKLARSGCPLHAFTEATASFPKFYIHDSYHHLPSFMSSLYPQIFTVTALTPEPLSHHSSYSCQNPWWLDCFHKGPS